MEMQSLRELFKKADMGGYAIPHFNYSDIWDLKAIIEAAEEEGAPIIVASLPKVVEIISPEICGAIGIAAMKRATIPIVHHLDHSTSTELCKVTIDNGYPSVMIDGSKLSLEENIRITKEIVEYGHSKGVHVEGELGKIKGKGYEGNFTGGDFLIEVEEAVRLVKETGVDSLAVGIGTAHGFYEGKPEINFKRLAEVNKAVDIPLVLHGGTGIPAEDVKRAIREGINKVNVGTIIRYTYMKYLSEELMKNDPVTHPADIIKPVLEKIKTEVKGWIRACMANGKA